MNPNLKEAVVHFLADEFHLSPDNILPDTDFMLDFNLSADQLTDLIERLQDALDFVLPEDKVGNIQTVRDLFVCLTPETHDSESE
jgi:acyl carrier protein